MKHRGKYYQCKKCKTTQFIPYKELKVKGVKITAVFCPSFKCLKHKYKMYEVETQ